MTDNSHILSRDNTLWLQGASAMMIMLMHFVMQLDGYPRVLNVLGSVGVAVFLFLSGFGINESYKTRGLEGYWRKRICRVVIPCWIVFMFRLPFAERFDAVQLFHNLIFTDSDLWFIDYILRWYAVYWIGRRLMPRHTTLLLVAASVVSVFEQQLMSEQSLSFLAGYLVSRHYDGIKRIHQGRMALVGAACLVYGAVFMILKQQPAVRPCIGTLPFNLLLLNIKLPFAITVLTLPYLLTAVKKIVPLKTCGRISFEIYIVHASFMPFVTDIPTLCAGVVFSLVIASVFHLVCNRLRQPDQFLRCMAEVLFVGVCYLLACKYTMRATAHFGYIVVPYILLLCVVLWTLYAHREWWTKHTGRKGVWTAVAGLALLSVAVNLHTDPMALAVDRWSALAHPIAALFDGKFPYTAQTHLGGYASPFPVWMVLHIPFWLLRDVGLSLPLCALAFVWSVWYLRGEKAAAIAAVLLLLCVNYWYEVAVWSDFIGNFLLLSAFVNLLLTKEQRHPGYIERHFLAIAAICGLWLSTRLSTAFVFEVVLLPYFIRLKRRTQVFSLLIASLVFAATFLPLLLWDSDEMLFAQYNPFVLQTRQGTPAVTIVLVLLSTCLALWGRRTVERRLLAAGLIALLIPLITHVHNMYANGNWTDLYNSTYDITYYDAALPFLITLLSIDTK